MWRDDGTASLGVSPGVKHNHYAHAKLLENCVGMPYGYFPKAGGIPLMIDPFTSLDKVYKTGIIDKCFLLEYIRGSYKTLSSDSFNFAVKDIHAWKILGFSHEAIRIPKKYPSSTEKG
ncbi:unnamed protein product [Notodromas monacha]|uniref:Uncharacterized protein n=1 Tax=Notodromas monacha TaxID=399045 RepID=A0A7R9BXH4_9CRUS|nr:unnamed protein product [Notodromas monacha]CAG0923595.1 unnamed protein product [Notodromas monacha]